VFEELFVCGYVITALKERFGTTAAINVSAGIRVFYHFYQGALGAGRDWPTVRPHMERGAGEVPGSMAAPGGRSH
jgi:membrane protease YdiL (CAAX protease family)